MTIARIMRRLKRKTSLALARYAILMEESAAAQELWDAGHGSLIPPSMLKR